MKSYLYLFILIKFLSSTNADNNTISTPVTVEPTPKTQNLTLDILNEIIRLAKESQKSCNKTILQSDNQDEKISKQNSINLNVNFNFGGKKNFPSEMNSDHEVRNKSKKHKYTIVWLDEDKNEKYVQEQPRKKPTKYYFKFSRPQQQSQKNLRLFEFADQRNSQKPPFPFKSLKTIFEQEKPKQQEQFNYYIDNRILKNWIKKRNSNNNA